MHYKNNGTKNTLITWMTQLAKHVLPRLQSPRRPSTVKNGRDKNEMMTNDSATGLGQWLKW